MNGLQRVAVYCRCSTSEAKQDVQSQVDACVNYCEGQKWRYEVFIEYESAYRLKKRPIFENMLERIRLKEFNVLLVYMLDRFSRAKPTQIVADFNRIIEGYGCRFISLREAIDSEQPMFEIVLMTMSWMAHNYSRLLGIRVKEGIRVKKAKGKYTGGRPEKKVNPERLKAVISESGRFALRPLTVRYNANLPKKEQVSYQTIRKAYRLLVK